MLTLLLLPVMAVLQKQVPEGIHPHSLLLQPLLPMQPLPPLPPLLPHVHHLRLRQLAGLLLIRRL